MQPEILTDEQAAAIWSGQTSSLLGLEQTPPPAEKKEEKPEEQPQVPPKEKPQVNEQDLDNLFHEEEDEPNSDEDTPPTDTPSATPVVPEKKPGRKPADLVASVNQMIEEGLLLAAEDDSGQAIEIKTIDEAKKLIKSNLEHRNSEDQEVWKDEYKKSLSPQIQAILHYAEQGAQSATEIMGLLGAIKEVEDAAEIDIKTPSGAERAIRETYKSKGFKDAYIDKQINILKDLGMNKLQEEAADLYPELLASKKALVERNIAEQEQRRLDAEEASKVYVSTIRKTLEKENVGGIKLTREEKARLYEAITLPKYKSLNGTNTNLFVKTLEDMQFGKDANYDHYMNVVHFAVDPKGFIEKLKTSVTNAVTDETFRQLKTAKSTSANADNDPINRSQLGNKKTLPRSGFVNPFA